MTRLLLALPPDEELEECDAVLVPEALVDPLADLIRHAVLVLLGEVSPQEVAEGPVRLVARRAPRREQLQHES